MHINRNKAKCSLEQKHIKKIYRLSATCGAILSQQMCNWNPKSVENDWQVGKV